MQIISRPQMSTYSVKQIGLKSAAKLYLRGQDELISYKYSPQYRKQKARKLRVSIHNPNLNRAIQFTKKKSQPPLNIPKPAHSPKANHQQPKQLSKEVSINEYQTIDKKLLTQQSKFNQSTASRLKSEEANRNRLLKNRLETSQKKRILQQIQFQYKQKKRQKEVKQRQQQQQKSFIFQAHQQSIDMLKKNKSIKSKSQIKLIKQTYFQTERSHQFQVLKHKIAKIEEYQDLAYRKKFLKNQVFRPYTSTNLPPTLMISSKTIQSSQMNLRLLPKIDQVSKKKSFKTHKISPDKKKVNLHQNKKKHQSQAQQINPQKQPEKGQLKNYVLTQSLPVQKKSQLSDQTNGLPKQVINGISIQNADRKESEIKKI